MERKGMAPIIATVLLIFFAISLGAIVMNWGSSYAELQHDIDKKKEEAKIKCNKLVNLVALNNEKNNFCTIPTKKIIKFKLKNAGKIPVDGIRVILIGGKNFETEFFDDNSLKLLPNKEKIISKSYDYDRLGKIAQMDIVPKIDLKHEGKLFTCPQKIEISNIPNC